MFQIFFIGNGGLAHLAFGKGGRVVSLEVDARLPFLGPGVHRELEFIERGGMCVPCQS